MFATALIVFREVLEAALIVSIVLAASKGIAERGKWVSIGIGAGLLGAGLVAAFAGAISDAAAGMGQEVLNATILGLAVLMLGWHVIWMSRHGRQLAQEMGAVAKAVASGNRPLTALTLATGTAVLREGSETVLFLSGIAASEDNAVIALLSGGAIGLIGGIAAGAALYLGLLRIPVRYLFSVTNWLVLGLAAGMAAQAAGFLVQAGLLPDLGAPLWDTSWLLSEKSLPGKILHALFGYVARPAGSQVLFFVATLAIIGVLMRLFSRSAKPASKTVAASLATLAIVLANLTSAPSPVRADFKIQEPNVDYREVEIENNFSTTVDKRPDMRGRKSMTQEIGIGVLPFWFIGLEGEFGREPGEKWQFNATTIENKFMLTEPGKYWMDAALYAEFSRARSRTDADTMKVGALFQKEQMKFVSTLNVFLEKEVGRNAGTADTVSYALQTRYRFSPLFQPGIELFGKIEDVNSAGKFNDRQLRIGPVIAGAASLGDILGRGKIKYEVGYLFGTTSPTEQGTIRTRLEIEIPF